MGGGGEDASVGWGRAGDEEELVRVERVGRESGRRRRGGGGRRRRRRGRRQRRRRQRRRPRGERLRGRDRLDLLDDVQLLVGRHGDEVGFRRCFCFCFAFDPSTLLDPREREMEEKERQPFQAVVVVRLAAGFLLARARSAGGSRLPLCERHTRVEPNSSWVGGNPPTGMERARHHAHVSIQGSARSLAAGRSSIRHGGRGNARVAHMVMRDKSKAGEPAMPLYSSRRSLRSFGHGGRERARSLSHA